LRIVNPANMGEFWNNYSSWEKQVEASFLKMPGATVEDLAIKKGVGLSMGDLLASLPVAEQKRHMKAYRALIGFDINIEKALEFKGMRNVVAGDNKLRRIQVEPAQIEARNPIAIIHNALNIQYDEMRSLKPGMGGGPAANFSIGRNIMTRRQLELATNARRMADDFAGGASAYIFDTETAGLKADLAGVRQVAGGRFSLSDGNLVEPTNFLDSSFKSARMNFGSVYDDGRLISLSDKFDAGVIGRPGEHFAERLMPHLQEMLNTDYIVGHNVAFDLGQVFTNLKKTAEYHQNTAIGGVGVKDIVDKLTSRIQHGDNVIDTLHLARQLPELANMQLAKGLEETGKASIYSLQNIMLKTNLAQLMIRDMGDDATEFFTGGVQHTADYDTRLTAYLLKYMSGPNPELRHFGKADLVRGAAGEARSLLEQIRLNTLRSGAITPTTAIRNVGDMDPRLFERLLKNDARFEIRKVTKRGGIRALTADEIAERTSDDWYKTLLDEKQPYVLNSRFSFMEQEMWGARHYDKVVVRGVSTPEDIIGGLGEWRALSGLDTPYEGLLNLDSTLSKLGRRPGGGEFRSMRRAMGEAGNQFANLSIPERMLTNALTMAGQVVETADEKGALSIGSILEREGLGYKRAVNVAEDLGISHFIAQSKIYGTEVEGGSVSLPLDILKAAESEGILGSNFADDAAKPLQMLGLSPFENAREGKVVNLMYQFQEDEAAQLAGWIRDSFEKGELAGKPLKDWEISSLGELEKLARNIETGGAEYGVNVGYLNKQGGALVHGAWESLFGSVRDRGAAPMRVAYAGEVGEAIRVGPAILNRGMSESDIGSLRRGVYTAVNQFQSVAEHLEDNDVYGQVKKQLSGKISRGGDLAEEAANVFPQNFYNAAKAAGRKIGPKKLALGAGLALGSYYLLKKRQDRAPAMESFQQMPIEGRSHREPMYYPETYRRMTDPLATAGVTGYYDNNKSNHTLMGTNKYAALFNG